MIQSVVSGLAIGGVYALLAVAFLLTYRVSGVLNFAQGQFVMLGAFIGASAVNALGAPLFAAALAGIGVAALAGVVMERVSYWPLQGRSHASLIVATVAVGIVLEQAAQLIWGPAPRTLGSLIPDRPLSVFGVRISSVSVFIALVSVILVVAVNLLLHRTRLGRQMQATAVDAETAKLMGIRTGVIVIVAFAIGCGLSGAAGVLIAPMFAVSTSLGTMIALKAFAACVIGGFGNLPGAAIAAFGVGVVENLSGTYIGSNSKDLIAFALMIAFLVIRPDGIFGSRVGEKL